MDERLPMPDAPLAAIDIGSNSFRLEVGRWGGGRYERETYLKQTVRLGGGLDADGTLGEDAAQRGLTCLREFAEVLRGFDPSQVRAVATQTLREARNRDVFLARAREALGFPVEVISGREEARLIYGGVAALQPSDERRLVIDIGGRSTEMIIGAGTEPQVAESFQVGSVSLSMRWFADGVFTAERFRDAQVAAGAELEEALETFSPNRWAQALGSSGTAGAVSQILVAAGLSDGTITPEGLRWCILRCLEAGDASRLALPSLREDRRPIIAGGLSLLYTLLVQFGIGALRPARGALRQGVIIDLAQRHVAERGLRRRLDPRAAGVLEMQRRFAVDARQAERVSALACALYASAADDDPHGLLELGWAGELHEVGMCVSHHDHHRHSAYLVAHADAAGFSESQQRRLADLVLGQRGGLRKVDAALAEPRFAWQVLALRLAVVACHARSDVGAEALELRGAGERRATLAIARGWADQRPRTMHLLHEEAAHWSRHGALRLDLALE